MLGGHSCQDATLIWGSGMGSRCCQPGLSRNCFFKDCSGLTRGTGYREGKRGRGTCQEVGGGGWQELKTSLLTSPVSLLL